MCPACIANTPMMVAGVAPTGGILAVGIGKFRKFLRSSALDVFQTAMDMMKVCGWQLLRRATSSSSRSAVSMCCVIPGKMERISKSAK